MVVYVINKTWYFSTSRLHLSLSKRKTLYEHTHKYSSVGVSGRSCCWFWWGQREECEHMSPHPSLWPQAHSSRQSAASQDKLASHEEAKTQSQSTETQLKQIQTEW